MLLGQVYLDEGNCGKSGLNFQGKTFGWSDSIENLWGGEGKKIKIKKLTNEYHNEEVTKF